MPSKRIIYTADTLRALAPLTASMDLPEEIKRKFDIIEVGEPAAPAKRRDVLDRDGGGVNGSVLEAIANSSTSASPPGASPGSAPPGVTVAATDATTTGNHITSSTWGTSGGRSTVGINISLSVHGGGGGSGTNNSGSSGGGGGNSNNNNSGTGRGHDRRGGNNNNNNHNHNNSNNAGGHHNHHNHGNNHNNNSNNNNNNNSNSNNNGCNTGNANATNTNSVYSNFDSRVDDHRRPHGSDRFAPPTRAWRGNRNDEAFEEGYKYELERKAAHRKQLSEMIKREEHKDERLHSIRERDSGSRSTPLSAVNDNSAMRNASPTLAGTNSQANNSEASVSARDGLAVVTMPEETVTDEFENLLAGITVADENKASARRSRFFGNNAVAATGTTSTISSASASHNNNTSHSHSSATGGSRVMNRGGQAVSDASYYEFNSMNANVVNNNNNNISSPADLTHMATSFNTHAMNHAAGAAMSAEKGWPAASGAGVPTSTAAELANMWTTGAAVTLAKKLGNNAGGNVGNGSNKSAAATAGSGGAAPGAEPASGGFTVTSGSNHAATGLDGLVFRGAPGTGAEEMGAGLGSAGAGMRVDTMTSSPMGIGSAGGMSFVTAPNVRNSRSSAAQSGLGSPTYLTQPNYHHDMSSSSSSAHCPDAPPPSAASIPTFSTASVPARPAAEARSAQNKGNSRTTSSASSAAAAPMIWRAQDLEQMLMKSAQQIKAAPTAMSSGAAQDGAAMPKRPIMVSELEGMLIEQARQGGGAGVGTSNSMSTAAAAAAAAAAAGNKQQGAVPFPTSNTSAAHHPAMQLQSSGMHTPPSQTQGQPTTAPSQAMMRPSVVMPGCVSTQPSAAAAPFSTKHAPAQQISATLPGQSTMGLNMSSAWTQVPRMNVAQRAGMQPQTPPQQNHGGDTLQGKMGGMSQPQGGGLHSAMPGVQMPQMMTAPAQYFTTQHQQPTYFVSQQTQQDAQQQQQQAQQTAQQMMYRTNAGNLLTPQQQQQQHQLNLFGTGAQYLVPQAQQQQPRR